MDKHCIEIMQTVDGIPTKSVPADVYLSDLRKRVQMLIGSMEEVCYVYEGGKPKSKWNEYALAKFNAFRHEALDIGDEVEAICDHMIVQESDSPSIWKGLFGRG